MTRGRHELNERVRCWLDERGFTPFEFQRRTWAAHERGESGLVHAPTGTGKTLAVWLGPVSRYLDEIGGAPSRHGKRDDAEPLRVLWITPLRALATDTANALREPVNAMGLPWTIETRTGDTPQSMRAKQRDRLPTALVTTPESLSLMLSHADARTRLARVDTVVVDEWHELMSSKRGVQTELALARLRRFAQDAGSRAISVWGLSATIANLNEAARHLVGVHAAEPALISADIDKPTVIETLIPPDIERFPWAGHLGLKLLPEVIERIEAAESSLVFCNTRSQVELWFKALLEARPDWLGRVSLHHGSIDRDVREKVENALREGRAKCVVCTSSLDLGVDFSPVDLVFQVGSPKGVARLLQRAGRSGHQPGSVSRVIGVPAHAFELVEFAAARDAANERRIEPRTPYRKPLDVLVQHLVTLATGEGFDADGLLREVRTTAAYAELTEREFSWALDFVTRGGPALDAYPDFKRVAPPEGDPPRFRVASRRIATAHRLAIGTITSDSAMNVRFTSGKSLGTIEESFVSKLSPGSRFVFAGRVLELVRTRDMTAFVKRATSTKGIVPRWGGGRSPLSTQLAKSVRTKLHQARELDATDPELAAVRPILELQREVSELPGPDTLLVEITESRDGHHVFLFPFEGRQVHEGLGSLLAHRIAAESPRTLTTTPNDYGLELLSDTPFEIDADALARVLSPDALVDDLLRCLNSGELARRRFRDVARIAGLIHPGFPGKQSKAVRHLQASSEMFFEVFSDFDPDNLLLDQARREVLEDALEVARLRACLERCVESEIRVVRTERLSPLAFPLFAERLRTQTVSSEDFRARIERMAYDLDESAPGETRARRPAGAASATKAGR